MPKDIDWPPRNASHTYFYGNVRLAGDSKAHVGALGLGMLLISLFAARHFGRFNGGNAAKAP